MENGRLSVQGEIGLGIQLLIYNFNLSEFALAIAAVAGIILSIIFTATGKINDVKMEEYVESGGFEVKEE